MGKNSLYSCYIASEILSLLCSQIKKKIYHLTHMGSLKTHTAKTLLRILNDNWLERVMQLMYPQYKLWKILKEMGIPDHLICLLRNLYAGQEATVKTGHGTTDWFQMGKECLKPVYCHPTYLNQAEYIMRNAGLEEAQVRIKIAKRNINNLR